MKGRRGGADQDERTFGPVLAEDTEWLARRRRVQWDILTRRFITLSIDERIVKGPSAFAALASIGWTLGEILTIEPLSKESIHGKQ